jgi:hypothetical protein
MIQFRITLRNACASNRFATLANLWMQGSRGCGIHRGIREKVLLEITGYQWEDDEVALEEIKMITSTYCLAPGRKSWSL